MGHSHSSSSSHSKRLRSISSVKNCEFTEVVDLEFSDVSADLEPATKIINKDSSSNIIKEMESPIIKESNYPKKLLNLEEKVKEIEQNIAEMNDDDFFVHFPTFKDELHNCWQKVYDLKEPNLETKLKKYKIIDEIRYLLKSLNIRLQRRETSLQRNSLLSSNSN